MVLACGVIFENGWERDMAHSTGWVETWLPKLIFGLRMSAGERLSVGNPSNGRLATVHAEDAISRQD